MWEGYGEAATFIQSFLWFVIVVMKMDALCIIVTLWLTNSLAGKLLWIKQQKPKQTKNGQEPHETE